MSPELYSRVIERAWAIAEHSGLASLSATTIAADLGINPVEVDALLPAPSSILLMLLEDVAGKVVLPEKGGLTEQDQLFDCFMAYFDAAQPRKAAIKKIWQDSFLHPLVVAQGLPDSVKYIHKIADHVFTNNPWYVQHLCYLALQAIAAYVFTVWLDDETLDNSKTMAALDFSLKQASQIKQFVGMG